MKKLSLVALMATMTVSLAGCQVASDLNPMKQHATTGAPEVAQTTDAADQTTLDKVTAVKDALTNIANSGQIQDQQKYIDAMTSLGFDSSHIQVSQVTTPSTEAPDSVQVAVQFENHCIVSDATQGKVNPVVLPILANGKCFVAEAP
ncbi:MAG: hypothetical protein QM632_05355 [Micrococcaceae bacterium]